MCARVSEVTVLVGVVAFLAGCMTDGETVLDRGARATGFPVRSLMLVANGRPAATIVIPDDADSWTRMAAGWVQEYVAKSSGAKLPIVAESKAPKGTLISVGHTDLARQAGVTTEDLEYDGYRIVAKARVLYIIGRDSSVRKGAKPGWPTEAWGYHTWVRKRADAIGAKGTCMAAVNFLDKICGVRWLIPAADGVYVPKMKDISVPGDLNIEQKRPVFVFGNGRYFYGSAYGSPAAFANNIRCSVRLKTYGGHSYYSWLSKGRYYKDHPEYFALIKGKRTGQGNHLCTSNPEVRKILLKELLWLFDHGYDWVQLGQSDGYHACECEQCRALDNWDGERRDGESQYEYLKRQREYPPEHLHLAHKWLADQARKSHPDKTVHMLSAYWPNRYPSKVFDRFPDNVVCEICGNGDPKWVGAWRGQGRGMTVYVCWFDVTGAPGLGLRMTPDEASEMIRYYADAGVMGIYYGGAGEVWGLMGPTYYVLGRLMGDPRRDYRVLVKEYCDGLYGDAADEMRAFFAMLHRRSLRPYWKLRRTTPETFRTVYSARYVKELDNLLRKAERAASTERSKQWVRLSRDEFDYVKYVATMLHLYEAYLVTEDAARLKDLKKAVDDFNAWRRRMLAYKGERVRDHFPGHGFLCKFLTTGINSGYYYASWTKLKTQSNFNRLDETGIGYIGSAIDKPITLDFDALKTTGMGFPIKRTSTPPKLDGVLDPKEWEGTKPVFMRGEVATEVRGMYDDKNLYVVFQCEEPLVDKIQVKETGRDGPAYSMECVEFFVDPETSFFARRYYHFITAPEKNALYDDRTGFKSANDQDWHWNSPGFRYGYSLDRKNKRWTIEMLVPFADLSAPPPQSGDVWMGNLARERYVRKQLYQWSKGGTGGFCNPMSFGRFRFE